MVKHAWYVKIDIQGYFDSISHFLLFELLQRRVKGNEILKLLQKIINSYCSTLGKGLPIGTLPSQHFANYFLDSADRYLKEKLRVKAHIRYMDDIIWWCNDREEAKSTLASIAEYIEKTLSLKIKEHVTQINKSKRGVTYCGFRVLPGKIKLSCRKRKRYSKMRNKWENAYMANTIDSTKLQSVYYSVNSIISHAHSREWKKQQLQRYPAPDC